MKQKIYLVNVKRSVDFGMVTVALFWDKQEATELMRALNTVPGVFSALGEAILPKAPIEPKKRRVFQLRREVVNSEPVNVGVAVNKGSGCQPLPSSEEGLKRFREGVAHPAGLLPPYIQSEMVLCDPETGMKWRVESCSGFPSEPQGVVANLVEPGRSRTVACNVLRSWPLGEDWTDEDADEGATDEG